VRIFLDVTQPPTDAAEYLFGDGGDGEREGDVLEIEEGRGGGEGEGRCGQQGRGGGYRVAHGIELNGCELNEVVSVLKGGYRGC
jgi:hypothetical protein